MKYASILASSAREDGLPKKKLNKYTYILQIGFFFLSQANYYQNKQISFHFVRKRLERDWKEVAQVNLQNQDQSMSANCSNKNLISYVMHICFIKIYYFRKIPVITPNSTKNIKNQFCLVYDTH